MTSKIESEDVATTNFSHAESEMKENGETEKIQENSNCDNEEKETALDFVNNAIDATIKQLKLHKLSSLGNIKTQNDKINTNEENDENEDWQSDDETYQTVVLHNIALLRKLLQLADDISVENDSKFTKERKISILQNIGFAIWRMDNKINESDSIMDMDDIFLKAIDNSVEMKSKLKIRGDTMDEKSVKNLIKTMHQKTKMEGLMTDSTQLSMMAYIMSIRELKHSFQQIFKCMQIYIVACQSLKLEEPIDRRKVKDFIESEEFQSECDEIFEIAKDYLDLPINEEECDSSEDSDNSDNTGDNDTPNNNDATNDNSNENSENKATENLTDNNPTKETGKEDKQENEKSQSKEKAKEKKKKKKACIGVRFDKENRVLNKRVYYGSETLKNVYNGMLKWNPLFEDGCDYYSIDCNNKLLSFCAGTGCKYREPKIRCYYFSNNNHNNNNSNDIGNDGNKSGKLRRYRYRCDAGFGDVPRHCYCDDIYNRIWFQGDSRIKGTCMIDSNDNNGNNEKKKSGNTNQGFEYILRGTGMITSTKDAIMSLNESGTLHVWYYDKLMKQNKSYWKLAGDDQELPQKDEFGIELNKRISENVWFDDEDKPIEISNGQKPHLTKKIELFYKNEEISKIGNESDRVDTRMSVINNTNNDKLVVSYGNTVNLYDLNKECVDNVYLGGRFNVKLPKRQHLYSKDNCTLVGFDFNCVKIWDTRMGIIAHTSIYGCGKKNMDTALGFNVNGHSFIATGGNDEAVTIWDLRRSRNNTKTNYCNNGALYEMSTGNNVVCELAWQESRLTLYATTDCLYIDRLGYRYYGDDVGDREDCDSDGNELDWPQRAVHKKGDFKSDYDSGTNAICSYSFLSN